MSHTPFLDAMEERLRREYPDRCPPSRCVDITPESPAPREGLRAVQLNDGDGAREAIVHIDWCRNGDLPRVLVYQRTAYVLQSLAGGRLHGEKIPTYWSAYTEHVRTPKPRRDS